MPRECGQDAKGRVVRLVEERILVENMLMQAAGSSSKAGRFMAHGPSMDVSRPGVRETSQKPVPEDVAAENARLRRITSYATLTNC